MTGVAPLLHVGQGIAIRPFCGFCATCANLEIFAFLKEDSSEKITLFHMSTVQSLRFLANSCYSWLCSLSRYGFSAEAQFPRRLFWTFFGQCAATPLLDMSSWSLTASLLSVNLTRSPASISLSISGARRVSLASQWFLLSYVYEILNTAKFEVPRVQ